MEVSEKAKAAVTRATVDAWWDLAGRDSDQMVKLEDFPQVARDWKREFPIGNRVPVIVPHRLHRVAGRLEGRSRYTIVD